MNKENYKMLLDKHNDDCVNGITKQILKKHIFEIFIFPKINEFELGEYVSIPQFGEFGYIEQFNSNGTLFIKKHFSHMGRDYSLDFVKKIEKQIK
tara:strand:+ start:515 stop:799 length:285 start_codon:yes stop_codon:yes gene_type:complete